MKRFIHKVQVLGKKAEEIKAAIDTLPGKAAEIRESITMTAGELQQIRSNVQGSLKGLQVSTEDHLLKAMREINDNTETFAKAGYELTDLELDLGMAQRLSVHLQKFEDVPHATISTLLARETTESIRSILAGIIKAEETAANVELTHLSYNGLIIHVGALPVIRLSWSSDTLMDEPETVPAPPLPQTSQGAIFPNIPGHSFFERRPTVAQPAATAPVQPLAAQSPAPISTNSESAPAVTTSATPMSGSQWAKESLERFKKMPSASKYGK
jgi:hypothetical protein